MNEGKPVEISITHKVQVSAANLGSCSITICGDEVSAIAHVHRNGNCRELVALEADLSHFSKSELRPMETVKGADGNVYYQVPGTIEATSYSASAKYVLVRKGKGTTL